VIRAGSSTFVRKLATILRDLFINRMNLAVALPTTAVAARGVQNDLNTLMSCIGLGLGKTLISMTGIYYSVKDKRGLKRLFITAKTPTLGRPSLSISVTSCARVTRRKRFCLDHGVDEKLARWMVLFVEEMAGNILQHGVPRKADRACVDYRIFVNKGRICLCLRDYCEAFDPTRYFEAHRNDSDYDHTGIRMVMSRAKEVRYFNTFGGNNILLYVN